MSRFKYTESEKQINKVLKYQDELLSSIQFQATEKNEATFQKTEELRCELGYEPTELKNLSTVPKMPKFMVVPTWEELSTEAVRHVGTDCDLESLFTEEELRSDELVICQLN